MPGKEKLSLCLESALLYINEDDMNIYSLQDYAMYTLMVLRAVDFKEAKQENLNISSKLFKLSVTAISHIYSICCAHMPSREILCLEEVKFQFPVKIFGICRTLYIHNKMFLHLNA